MIGSYHEMAKGYKKSSRCATCNSKAADGRPLRREIDDRLASGESTESVRVWAGQQGFVISLQNLYRHTREHSPQVRDADVLKAQKKVILGEYKAIKRTQEIQKEAKTAEEVLDKIIEAGTENLESGDIVVDGNMLIKAVDVKMKYGSSEKIELLQGDLINALEEGVPPHVTPLLEAEVD